MNDFEDLFFDSTAEPGGSIFGSYKSTASVKYVPGAAPTENISLTQAFNEASHHADLTASQYCTLTKDEDINITNSQKHVAGNKSVFPRHFSHSSERRPPSPRVGVVAPTPSSSTTGRVPPFKRIESSQIPSAKVHHLSNYKSNYSLQHGSHLGVDGRSSQEDLFSSGVTSTPMPLSVTRMRPNGSVHSTMDLRPVAELPPIYHSIFNFPYFNIVQSKVFDDVLYTDKPIVLCAPTGSGKTVVFELAIIRLMLQHRNVATTNFKVIYMAPMKALCSERHDDWQQKFSAIGLKCMQLTGDTQMDDYLELQDVHIILTTPEKWDSMTRRWRDNMSLVQQVRLFLIDEVHLLNDDTRGATMEAVVSRMKTVQVALNRQTAPPAGSDGVDAARGIRFIAVSATIPNVEDLADWVGSSELQAAHYKMDDSYRPVRLRKVVIGYPSSDNMSEFRFDLSLNYKLASVIQIYSEQKPTLVFCATRKGAVQAANTLLKEAKFVFNSQHKQRLLAYSNSMKDSKLRDLVSFGIGYHHAGLDFQDRKLTEEAFSKSDLPVLMATSTLAMGVNLPAHLVVIKSTQHYVMGVYQEYSESQILQMIGRAGRPQFDTTATAVIMTRAQTKVKYNALLSGTQLIESSLHQHLVEHLNAEIVLNTINDVAVAMQWIKSTFLYIRVMKNPTHYGMAAELHGDQIEQKLQELCLKNLNSLAAVKLVKMDCDGFDLKATDTGKLMARYCVSFETMKNFHQIVGTETMEEMLNILCSSEEFKDIQLRTNEKKTLNTLNKDKNRLTIRFQLPSKIKTSELKVNCLIQTQLGCLLLQDFALQQDTNKIFRATMRITRCLVEVLWQRNDFKTLTNAILLAKCFKAKLWENSKHVSRQLTGIGPTLSSALVNAGLVTFQKVEETNPREIEMIVNRHPPFGNQVLDTVKKLPKYELSIDQSSRYTDNVAELTLSVKITNRDVIAEKGSAASAAHTSVLLVGDADNTVLYKTRLSDALLLREGTWSKMLVVRRSVKGEELGVNFISQDWVGLDVRSKYTPFYSGIRRLAPSQQTQSAAKPASTNDRTGAGRALNENYRPCGHRCLKKENCGHECCRVGILIKKVPRPRPAATSSSMMDSYRQDLRARMEHIPATPNCKRLKIEKSCMSTDFSKYSYTPKPKLSTDVPMTPVTPRGWDHLDRYTEQTQPNDIVWQQSDEELDNFPVHEMDKSNSCAVSQNVTGWQRGRSPVCAQQLSHAYIDDQDECSTEYWTGIADHYDDFQEEQLPTTAATASRKQTLPPTSLPRRQRIAGSLLPATGRPTSSDVQKSTCYKQQPANMERPNTQAGTRSMSRNYKQVTDVGERSLQPVFTDTRSTNCVSASTNIKEDDGCALSILNDRGEFTLFDEEELYNEYADEDIGTASSNVNDYEYKSMALQSTLCSGTKVPSQNILTCNKNRCELEEMQDIHDDIFAGIF